MAPFACAPMARSSAACPSHSSFVREDIDVVEVGEAVDVGEIVVVDLKASWNLHLRALGKAFVFGRIACPMRSVPNPLV
jgi:hypothetical protein